MPIAIRAERSTLEELARRSELVPSQRREVIWWRVIALLVLAIALLPVTFIVAYVSFSTSFFVRLATAFVRRTERDAPRSLEVLAFRIRHAHRLEATDDPTLVVLLLETTADQTVALGSEWKRGDDPEHDTFRNWAIHRDPQSTAPIAIRAWGRCRTRSLRLPSSTIERFRNRVELVDGSVVTELPARSGPRILAS